MDFIDYDPEYEACRITGHRSWPVGQLLRPKQGFAREGRTWPRVNLGDLSTLFGHMLDDCSRFAIYCDVLCHPLTINTVTAEFNVTLRRINRGMHRPNLRLSHELEDYLHQHAARHSVNPRHAVAIRLAVFRGGAFFEWPLDFENGDEGFLEEYLENMDPYL